MTYGDSIIYQEDDDQTSSLPDDGLPEFFDHDYEPLRWEYPPSRWYCSVTVLYLVLGTLVLYSNRTLKLWTVVSGLRVG